MPSLQPVGPGIWLADGTPVSVAGFQYPTRMALIQLGDGGLFAWSPVALTDTMRAEVEALGPVRFIVAPNSLHHLFVPQWQAAFPSARTIAAPGLAARRKDLTFDGTLEDTPDAGWANEIDQVIVRGNAITTEVVFFHKPSGTVLITDLLQHFKPGAFRGLARAGGEAGRDDGGRTSRAAEIPLGLHGQESSPYRDPPHPGMAPTETPDGPWPARGNGRRRIAAARLQMAESVRGSRWRV